MLVAAALAIQRVVANFTNGWDSGWPRRCQTATSSQREYVVQLMLPELRARVTRLAAEDK
jgi:hypothetical protein